MDVFVCVCALNYNGVKDTYLHMMTVVVMMQQLFKAQHILYTEHLYCSKQRTSSLQQPDIRLSKNIKEHTI